MDNNEEKDKEQQELDQASQKTAHVFLKAGAEHLLPGAGGKLYNSFSNNEHGKKIEGLAGKAFQATPIDRGLSKALDKSGALDAVDKGMDLVDGDSGPEGLQKANDIVSKVSDLSNVVGNNDKLSDEADTTSSDFSSDINEEEDNSSSSFGGITLSKKTKIIFMSGLIGFLFIIAIILMIASSVLGPVENAKEFVKNLWNGTVDFFTYFTLDGFLNSEDQEKKYYEKLHEVQKEYQEKGICIDINLITASLSAGKTLDKVIDDLDKEKQENKSEDDFIEMKQHIEVLAKMQIITKKYLISLIVNEDTKVNEGILDSSDIEKVANNDYYNEDFLTDASYIYSSVILNTINPVMSDFLLKKPIHESNYEFYLYNPVANLSDDIKNNPKNLKQYLDDNKNILKDKEFELSIGTYETMEESVFYWNLVNDFIPNYYSEYIPNNENKDKKIKEIAEEIYLLYKEIGPNQSCGQNAGYICSYTTDSGEDISNVKVELLACKDETRFKNLGEALVDFETYITGVTYAELGGSSNLEALKAQAVAARTYTLTHYDSISTDASGNTVIKIRNCTERQVYCDPDKGCWSNNSHANGTVHSGQVIGKPYSKPAISENSKIRTAVKETSGQTLKNNNGGVISISYNSTTQKSWDQKQNSTYLEMLMETYNDASDLQSQCIMNGPVDGYGDGTTTGSFVRVNYQIANTKHNLYWTKYSYGQCTHWAYGRAIQILVENGGYSISQAKDLMKNVGGNGGQWFQNAAKAGVFDYSAAKDPKVDPTGFAAQIRPGALISWVGGTTKYSVCGKEGCGHIAVIESVEYNPDGTIRKITTSNGGSGKNGFDSNFTNLESFYLDHTSRGPYPPGKVAAGFIYLLK